MTEDIQNRLAERLGQLLAESPLDDATKEQILDRLAEMTQGELFELHDMFLKERQQVSKIAAWHQILNQQSQGDWEKLEKAQQAAADNLSKKFQNGVDDQVKLKQIRDKLNNE